MEKELVIGQVAKPQGIRGEIKVTPYTDSAEAFLSLRRVFLDGTEYRVLSVRCGDGAVFLALKGVADRNAAELLRGKNVTIPREEAPEPEEGAYYIADLLGCIVETQEGEPLGTLTGIRPAGTDIYTLEREGKEILFPAAEGVILEVDAENGRIVVDKKRFGEVAVQ